MSLGIVRKHLGLTFLGEALAGQIVFGEIVVKNLTRDVGFHLQDHRGRF